jgi:hypothetical protein
VKRVSPRLLLANFVVLILPSICSADDAYQFLVPGRTWSVAFTMPALDKYQAQSEAGQFQLSGQAAGGLTMSLFVEPLAAPDSEACRQKYWADASRNPMITAASIKLTQIGGKPGVQYILEGDYQGQHVKAQNVNVYLANAGTCVDFHISRFPFSPGDDTRLAAIAGTLTVKQ